MGISKKNPQKNKLTKTKNKNKNKQTKNRCQSDAAKSLEKKNASIHQFTQVLLYISLKVLACNLVLVF